MQIDPKCLKFNNRLSKGAAYTSDGFMLPCCWMDHPNAYDYIVDAGLKDQQLAVANVSSLEEIFTSDQWENFFTTLLYEPENACHMCFKMCGQKDSNIIAKEV